MQLFLKVKMFLQVIIFSVCFCGSQAKDNLEANLTVKAKKAFSIFEVVKFPNLPCVGDSFLNGTCYTTSECTTKGGVSSGACAFGFGVCCTFIASCGDVVSENTTYFQAPAIIVPGQCSVSACKLNSDICQLRLDFIVFIINGPSTLTITISKSLYGVIASGGAGLPVSLATNCLTDTFSVTGSTTNPPVICGNNFNTHMYLDASPSCNTLMFQLGPINIGTNSISRAWNIQITQISCLSTSLPPQGCTQYFTGTSGVISSFNRQRRAQLANQRQNICIRRQRGFCKLCLSQVDPTVSSDFSVSGALQKGFVGRSSNCCGYGSGGAATIGGDCLVIPNAVKSTVSAVPIVGGNQFCGQYLVGTTIGTAAKTVCTKTVPFNIQFLTDDTTIGGGATGGFNLAFTQTPCTS